VDGISQLKKNVLIEEIVTEFTQKYSNDENTNKFSKNVVNSSRNTSKCGENTSKDTIKDAQDVSKDKSTKDDDNNENILVNCPVCSVLIDYSKVNDHLDSFCKTESRTRPAPTYKAQIPYSLYTTSKIKQILQEDGISTQGKRCDLIKRHSHFIDLYNSNQDSKQPLNNRSLIKKLNEIETPKKRPQTDVNNYLSQNNHLFNDLIQSIKKRKS
jgi:hypothetical protein